MTDANTHVDVSLSIGTYTDARKPAVVTLRVTDGPSAHTLVEVNLTAEQLVHAMNGLLLADIPGWITPRLDRIGKQVESKSFVVPREVTDPASLEDGDVEARIDAWVREQPFRDLYQTLEKRRTNSGWKIVARRYVVVSP